ncbi:MAG: alpha/beta fold hydrolase [Zavarzinella sp.]
MVADYPFQSHWLQVQENTRLHYLDEGNGPPVLLLHGNPTWSYYYRKLVSALRDRFRCIVPDHVGCGYSDKPGLDRYSYRLQDRIDNLEQLVDHLNISQPIHLIVHDWGGMIGFGWARTQTERIASITVLNSAAFPLPKTKRLPFRLWLGRNTWLGKWLIRSRNVFCKHALQVGAKRRKMSPEEQAAYLLPYDSWDNRVAVWKFVQTIPLSANDEGWDIVQETMGSLKNYHQTPAMIHWGALDFVFDKHFLTEWKVHLPNCNITMYSDCGHYILEDAGETIIPAVRDFLIKNSSMS